MFQQRVLIPLQLFKLLLPRSQGSKFFFGGFADLFQSCELCLEFLAAHDSVGGEIDVAATLSI
jgi:hypothetical protein